MQLLTSDLISGGSASCLTGFVSFRVEAHLRVRCFGHQQLYIGVQGSWCKYQRVKLEDCSPALQIEGAKPKNSLWCSPRKAIVSMTGGSIDVQLLLYPSIEYAYTAHAHLQTGQDRTGQDRQKQPTDLPPDTNRRHAERQIDRQTDRQTDRDRQTETDRQTDRQTNKPPHGRRNRQTYKKQTQV